MTSCGGCWVPLLLLLVWTPRSGAQTRPTELKQLSIEELMDIDVTLVSRQPEPLASAAAAVSVITRDDIRRSGVTTLAEALQLATGVHVARATNGSWSISARGLNGSTPNKLLVMIDGRSEYSPLFTGVFWNVLDYTLEDIDRIEVIRGPGATLWGANAVNGVVNIITRHAAQTQGTYASLSLGNEDVAIAEIRQGGARAGTSWRVYGKFAQRDDQQFSTGISAADARRWGQAGFRVDVGTDATDSWLFKGDLFHGRDDFLDRRDGEWTGIAVQGRWTRTVSPSARVELQSYYRREYRNIARQLTHHVDTVNVDLQHTLRAGSRHGVVWGAEYSRHSDSTHGTFAVSFDPPSRTYPVYSVFVQDEIALVPGRIDLTAGVKVEHNTFDGAELQPNVRARWTLPRRQTLWGAAARATRRPTRLDTDIVVSAPDGAVLIRGNPEFDAESLVATEVGYRVRPASFVSADVVVFRHRYDDLRSQDAPLSGGLPIVLGNTLNGRSAGLELALVVQPTARWSTHASYTHLDTEISRGPGSRDVSSGASEANDPRHMFGVRTSLDLRRNVELDARLRSIGALPNPPVPAYTELAVRIGWQPTPRLEVALIGTDLLHDQHPEFGTPVPRRVEFERGVRAAIALRLP